MSRAAEVKIEAAKLGLIVSVCQTRNTWLLKKDTLLAGPYLYLHWSGGEAELFSRLGVRGRKIRIGRIGLFNSVNWAMVRACAELQVMAAKDAAQRLGFDPYEPRFGEFL